MAQKRVAFVPSGEQLESRELLAPFTSHKHNPPPVATYYIAPIQTHGLGTLANPWGIPDLLTAGTPVRQGAALTSLAAGDTLDFRGGDFHVSGTTALGYFAQQLISPIHSGTASAPITLKSYPGETARIFLDAGNQPLFGTNGPAVNYVRFFGFTVQPTSVYDSGGGLLESASPFYISGTGNEVAYNEVIGQYVATTDNHDGIILHGATSAWLHHNNVHDFKGDGANSSCVKSYQSSASLIEDNYLHDSRTGMFDKDCTGSSSNDIFRRNFVTRNSDYQFAGINNPGTMTYQVYDNVIDGPITCIFGNNSSGTVQTLNNQIYNNLLRVSTFGTSGLFSVYNESRTSYLDNIWNNITIGTGAGIQAYQNVSASLTVGTPTSPLAYMDYNIYNGAPTYDFALHSLPHVTYTLAQFRTATGGFESHSAQDTTANIFVDQVNYVLKPFYQTAGRYGDPVGPRYPVAQIINPARYGPAAMPGPVTPTAKSRYFPNLTRLK